MGFRCPVCGDPQADDLHLANHLGFTAVVRGGEHEDWLDSYLPDWGQMDEETLASEVVQFADEMEYPQVFEGTTDDHDHLDDTTTGDSAAADSDEQLPPGTQRIPSVGQDDEVEEIIEEARELTKQMRKNEEDSTEDDS